MTLRIPAGPQDLTPQLLTELVSELRPGVTVTNAEIVKIKNYGEADNANAVSTSIQVSLLLTYREPAPASLPRRVLAKMSIPEDVNVANPDFLGPMFVNEVNFYNRLRGELDIETPVAVGARYNPETQRYVLLMEDLAPKSPHFNTMVDADDLKVVEAVIDTLARLHAQYWGSPRFTGDLAWIEQCTHGMLGDFYRNIISPHIAHEARREQFKREFIQEVGTTVEEMERRTYALKRYQETLAPTFCHGDAHFSNTYVMPDGTGGLIDWQLNVRGHAVHDIGYFIQTALSVEARRKHEQYLLKYYIDRLRSHGVQDAPTFDVLWKEYRRNMLWGFYIGWLVAPRENYGLEVCVMGIHRTKVAYDDLESAKLIDEIM